MTSSSGPTAYGLECQMQRCGTRVDCDPVLGADAVRDLFLEAVGQSPCGDPPRSQHLLNEAPSLPSRSGREKGRNDVLSHPRAAPSVSEGDDVHLFSRSTRAFPIRKPLP